MSGTKSGGLKARNTNISKYGKNYYKRLGEMGGKLGTTGGFWYAKHVTGDIDFIRESGAKGGRISRRPHGK